MNSRRSNPICGPSEEVDTEDAVDLDGPVDSALLRAAADTWYDATLRSGFRYPRQANRYGWSAAMSRWTPAPVAVAGGPRLGTAGRRRQGARPELGRHRRQLLRPGRAFAAGDLADLSAAFGPGPEPPVRELFRALTVAGVAEYLANA